MGIALNNMFFIDDLLPLFVLPVATGTRRSISVFQKKQRIAIFVVQFNKACILSPGFDSSYTKSKDEQR